MKTTDTKYLAIVEAIKAKITQGLYPPGTKLPGQLMLAEEYNVSAITSNRALNELSRLGFVERRQRSGSFVTDKTNSLTEITILLFESKARANIEAQEYCNGILARAQELNIPTQIICSPDPSFSRKLANKGEKQGFILLNFETPEVVKNIKDAFACCVVCGQKAKYNNFSVYTDFFNVSRDLTRKMLNDGCSKIAFMGLYDCLNHKLGLEGFIEEMELSDKKPFFFEVDEQNIKSKVKELLNEPEPYDALIIMGGHSPISALPYIFSSKKPHPKIGLFSENPIIMNLSGCAYMACYSQFEIGKMAVDLLKEIASDRKMSATAKHPPYKIIVPDNEFR
jgi:DNA-binding transcriptional regulator YhcF (GntR family)